ncbi:unnamed protein product [Lactuca saligna]|uniref:Uncharacterized protein n=1 Tax=Lactuca saligna TaxID=75948 RepID=A0AA35Z7I8_LACSI|nr:unnamed protein product [Lactuca saligna]
MDQEGINVDGGNEDGINVNGGNDDGINEKDLGLEMMNQGGMDSEEVIEEDIGIEGICGEVMKPEGDRTRRPGCGGHGQEAKTEK